MVMSACLIDLLEKKLGWLVSLLTVMSESLMNLLVKNMDWLV